MLAQLLGLLDETVLAFLEQVVVAAFPKTPGVAGGEFPTEGDAPEHGDDLHTEAGAEVHEPEEIIFRPVFDLLDGFAGDLGGNKGANAGAAGPGTGVDPERAMRGHAVQVHAGAGEGVFDFFGALKALLGLEHVVGRLGAGRAGFFGVSEKSGQTFGAVLRAFDRRMKNGLRHRVWLVYKGFWRKASLGIGQSNLCPSPRRSWKGGLSTMP